MAPTPITVAVGGGRALDRAGLAALLASLPGFHVVPQDNDPPPQVLVWATCADSMELPLLKSRTKLLLLTESTTEDSLPGAVHGLFSREETTSALAIAIRQIARGEQYLSPTLATAIIEKRQSKSGLASPKMSLIDELTEREREIVDLLAQGLSNKLIASKLYLSVRTVEGHLANIYLRLGVHSRTEAMLIAMKVR
ncbi:MAG TPA: response regulator transcription factor [Anaerolineales bacterium]|nr:response regulator transcription factor [Anaerolineales bacterium]